MVRNYKTVFVFERGIIMDIISEEKKIHVKGLYLIIRVSVLLLLAVSVFGLFIEGDDSDTSRNAFVILQTIELLVFSFAPKLIEKLFKVSIPNLLESSFLIFIILAQLFGEVAGFFIFVWWWDVMLHVFSGMFVTIIGFSIYNGFIIKSPDYKKFINPVFVALFVFCFALTVEVTWELVEYFFDSVSSNSNMLRTLNSETLIPYQGLEAIKDTMNDIILTICAASIISVLGYLDIKRNWNLFSRWMIHRKSII